MLGESREQPGTGASENEIAAVTAVTTRNQS